MTPVVEVVGGEVRVGAKRLALGGIEAIRMEVERPNLRLAIGAVFLGATLLIPALTSLGAAGDGFSLATAAVVATAVAMFGGVYMLACASERYSVFVVISGKQRRAAWTVEAEAAERIASSMRLAVDEARAMRGAVRAQEQAPR
jgi:hypothetical protein